MSQFDSDEFVDTISGSTLVTQLNSSFAAHQTSHSGTSRPSYAVAGMTWLDTTGAPWLWKMYDGTDDITLGAINATVNSFALQDKDGDTKIQIEESADEDIIRFDTAGSERMVIGAAGSVYIGDDANANMTVGLTINQGANDDEIVAGKSSDVAHGMTTLAETDTFFAMTKIVAATGGLDVVGYGEGAAGARMIGRATSVSTSKTSTADAPVEVRGEKKSGTTAVVMGANENVFVVTGGVTGPVFLADADGDLFASNATVGSSLDDLADVDLIRTHELSRSVKGIIRSEFDDWITYNKTTLEDAGIIGRVAPGEVNEDGSPATPMLSVTGLQRLHSGGLCQLLSQFRALANVMVDAMPELRGPMELALERAGVGHVRVLI